MVSQTSYRLISSRLTRDTVVPPPTYIRDPEIDSLPLVSDHRGHWFPLDAVILDDPHVHERFGNMVRDLKRRGATLLSLPLTEQKRYGKEFIDMIATAKVKVKVSQDLFYHICAILTMTGRRR
jgi:hypothetical protein